MIMVLKKRKVCAGFFVLLAAIGLTGAACHYFGSAKTFLPSEGRIVIIDAGHAAHKQYHIHSNRNGKDQYENRTGDGRRRNARYVHRRGNRCADGKRD